MSVVHAEELTKRYSTALGVGPIDLAVEPGEMVALTGPSGSGKSTLLAILGLLLSMDSGSLTLGGKRIDATTRPEIERLRRQFVGIVLQDHGLLSFLRTWENVALGKGRDVSMHRSDALATLSEVGLADFGERSISDLSGGERGRVAVARALVRRPQLLLADEPTGNLDPVNRDIVISLLRTAAENGAAVIVATHDEQVARGCDQVISLVAAGRRA